MRTDQAKLVTSSRVALAMLVVGWLALASGLGAEAARAGPERFIRGYLTALQGRQVESALAALTPETAERWRGFLEFQQFNRYSVLSIASRSPSLLESLSGGRPWRAVEATLVADITEPSGLVWRGSTVIPLEWRDDHWAMARPPFATAGQ